MKKILTPSIISLMAMTLLAGCDVEPKLSLGGGTKSYVYKPTIGQQLVDLKRARDSGAITDQEYQAQKTRILQGN